MVCNKLINRALQCAKSRSDELDAPDVERQTGGNQPFLDSLSPAQKTKTPREAVRLTRRRRFNRDPASVSLSGRDAQSARTLARNRSQPSCRPWLCSDQLSKPGSDRC